MSQECNCFDDFLTFSCKGMKLMVDSKDIQLPNGKDNQHLVTRDGQVVWENLPDTSPLENKIRELEKKVANMQVRANAPVCTVEKQFIAPVSEPAVNRRAFVVKGGTALRLPIPGVGGNPDYLNFSAGVDTLVDAEQRLDSGSKFQPGKDYSIYLCSTAASTSPASTVELVVSLNADCPVGYDADTSRKIGGFHTLCADAGVIAGHPLSGFMAGDILPASFWCLTHRPYPAKPEGMVYVAALDIWVDIYLQSGTGLNTRSAFGATITDTRCWDDHVEDLFSVGKTLLTDTEFSAAMDGSNQRTSIKGGVDPVTTGGHVDTANRRMLSRYGIEDGCGVRGQLLDQPSLDGLNWSSDSGGKGARRGTGYATSAGGHWTHAGGAGSRCRITESIPSYSPGISGRGRARSL